MVTTALSAARGSPGPRLEEEVFDRFFVRACPSIGSRSACALIHASRRWLDGWESNHMISRCSHKLDTKLVRAIASPSFGDVRINFTGARHEAQFLGFNLVTISRGTDCRRDAHDRI